MFIQWCVKGVFGIDDDEARAVINERGGLQCRWWRNVHTITPQQIRDKLTDENLDRHIHRYAESDPAQSGRPFCEGTPFISLAAGCVERDIFLRTNIVYPALMVALDFATDGFTREGYLYYLWTAVNLRPAVAVETVSEEVRALNVYRRFSRYQTEGEITAKIHIPSNQIHRCEKYSLASPGVVNPVPDWVHRNSHFDDPLVVSNIRQLF